MKNNRSYEWVLSWTTKAGRKYEKSFPTLKQPKWFGSGMVYDKTIDDMRIERRRVEPEAA